MFDSRCVIVTAYYVIYIIMNKTVELTPTRDKTGIVDATPRGKPI